MSKFYRNDKREGNVGVQITSIMIAKRLGVAAIVNTTLTGLGQVMTRRMGRGMKVSLYMKKKLKKEQKTKKH